MGGAKSATDVDELTGTEDHDEDDGIEDTEDLGEDGEGGGSVKARVRHAITGRGVTLAMLMADGVIEAGPDTMSIEYLVSGTIYHFKYRHIHDRFLYHLKRSTHEPA